MNNDDCSITISFEEIYRFNWELHGHDDHTIIIESPRFTQWSTPMLIR